ncbi:MAG TPA: hypothetical protein VHE61_21895 [Opitutaceae bacterium]|nr:hypothetical protein [Opitutaceae bacterium]
MNAPPQLPVRRWRAVLLLAGWFVATGMHWDVIQVVAWSRMWAHALRTESATAALASTFAPGASCELCRAVQSARTETEATTVPGQTEEKAPLLPVTILPVAVAHAAPAVRFPRSAILIPPQLRARPPVPPPRVA